MKNLFLFLAIILSITCVSAQVKEVTSIEISGTSKTSLVGIKNLEIINLNKNGIFLRDGLKEFSFFDTSLKLEEKLETGLKGGSLDLIESHYDSIENKIYLYKIFQGLQEIIIISPDTKKFKSLKLKKANKREKLERRVVKLGKKAFCVSANAKDIFLNTIDLDAGDVSHIDMPENWKNRELQDIRAVNSRLMAILYKERILRKWVSNIAIMDKNGEILSDKLLDLNTEYLCSLDDITDLGDEKFIISGDYYTISGLNKTIKKIGIYFTKIENLKQVYMKYFEYNSIKDFNKYAAKKDNYNDEIFHYSLVVHSVYYDDGSYVFISELSIPTRYYESNGSYFDYANTHAVFLRLNEEDGSLEYSKCLPIYREETTISPGATFDSYKKGEELVFCYCADDKLFEINYVVGKVDEEKPKDIEGFNEKENTKIESIAFRKWYGSYYFGLLAKKDVKTLKLIKYQL